MESIEFMYILVIAIIIIYLVYRMPILCSIRDVNYDELLKGIADNFNLKQKDKKTCSYLAGWKMLNNLQLLERDIECDVTYLTIWDEKNEKKLVSFKFNNSRPRLKLILGAIPIGHNLNMGFSYTSKNCPVYPVNV